MASEVVSGVTVGGGSTLSLSERHGEAPHSSLNSDVSLSRENACGAPGQAVHVRFWNAGKGFFRFWLWTEPSIFFCPLA